MAHSNTSNAGDERSAQLFHDIKNCLNNIALASSLLEIEFPTADNYIKEIKANYLKIKILIDNHIAEK